MAELETLVQLQAIDTELDQATTRIEQIRQSLGPTAEVLGARQALTATQARLQTVEARQRQLEWDVDDRSSKIKELDQKLYSGTIRNPKELSGLQTEVQHLREALNTVEEEALGVIEEADALRSEAENRQKALEAIEAAWRDSVARLRQEGTALTATLAPLRQRRTATAATVSAETLGRYDEVRRLRRGQAVARIDRNMCLGCRTAVPTSHVQSARQGKLTTCPSCGRFLYVGH
jgi:hypothetical protein